MRAMLRMTAIGVAAAAMAAGSQLAPMAVAQAQQAQTQRVAGPIEKVEGATLTVTTPQGAMKVSLTDTAAVFAVVNATLADIKPGSFIGVGAMPQPDGSQQAIRVMIFSEAQRGTGEGHRPWVRPGSTMTNATVETTVQSVDGQVLTVKYRGGEQKIVISPGVPILQYVPGDRSELKPGAPVSIFGAVKKPDGTLEAARVNVGRGGAVP